MVTISATFQDLNEMGSWHLRFLDKFHTYIQIGHFAQFEIDPMELKKMEHSFPPKTILIPFKGNVTVTA